MRFTDILKKVIVEQSRVEVLADKLTKPQGDKKPLLSARELFALMVADPETKVKPGVDIENFDGNFESIKKAGPYVQWLIKQYLSIVPNVEGEVIPKENEKEYKSVLKKLRGQFWEDLYKTTEDLKKFDRFKSRLPQEIRDINKLTIDSLFDAVKDFSLTKEKASAEEKQEAAKTFVHPGADLIYNGPNWVVTKITDTGKLGKDAACFFGGYNEETRWCTSAPGLQWFERYIGKGPLYQVFKKSSPISDKTGLPKERYQFHFQDSQFMDIQDRQIDLVNFLNNQAPEIKELFKHEFARNLQKKAGNDSQLVIEYPRDSTSKYIALYGWDDLLDSLDPSLTAIDFTNSSSEPLDLKFPAKLADLKNLQTFYVENGISEVPEELKGLKNLEFISFPNNKNLKELPEWLADMPNLIALSIKGAPANIKIPPRLKERIDNGDFWFVHNEG
jgi:hypothetical protein